MYGIQPAPALREDDLEIREAVEDPAHQPVDARHHGVQAVEGHEHGGGRVVRRRHEARRAADVHAHRDLGFVRDRPERIPVLRVHRRQAQHGRVLGERDRLGALGEHPFELGDGGVDVVQRQDRGAEEAGRFGRAPLVEQEVVVGLEAGEPELGVVHAEVEAVAGEAGEVGEAQLAPHAVDVHVLDPRDGVVATGADLVEPGGAGRRWVPGLGEARAARGTSPWGCR